MSKNYCVECKFAGQTSGEQVYCTKHETWMGKWGSCSDYIWIKSRFHSIHTLLLSVLLRFF